MSQNNIVVFSRNGVHFNEERRRRDTTGIFIPSRDQIRRFTDIGTVTPRTVRDRYGDVGQVPLWRMEANTVVVYGLLPEELEERRRTIDVFLPEDYAPANCSVFYYVFGNRWLVHGVRTVNEDGRATWASSKMDAKEGGVVDELLSAVSERVAEAKKENICIAVHGDDSVLKDVQDRLQPFGLEVVRFSSLTRPREAKPLYVHRDHGLLFMVAAMLALLMFFSAAAFAFKGSLDLAEIKLRIVQLEKQIQETQTNTRLGNIRNPQTILNFMSKPLTIRPSSVLHAAGDISTSFGVLNSVELDATKVETRKYNQPDEKGTMKPQSEKIVVVKTLAKGRGDMYLVDQENMAVSIMEESPWIRTMERRPGSQDSVQLDVGVRIE